MDRPKKLMKESTREKLRARKKEAKALLQQKRARLVVRNLPFTATIENLKEYFEKFGEITSIELLKKEDGKLVGCGFIQFKLVQKAAKARFHTNKQPFLGRNITVDFAKPKNKFNKEEIKQEPDVEVKEEPVENDGELLPVEVKVEEDETMKKEEIKDDDEAKSIESSNSESSDEEMEVDAEENEMESEEKVNPRISNDVAEGKTIFVKNVPFSATNEDLKECMLQFGPIYYALICMDKFTEHSKGTGFVKFVNKESAEKALEAGTELKLQGNILDCHPALARNDVQDKNNKNKLQKSQPKDSRNLYLVKEGVILAGTKAAEGVSAADMAKRLQLEQYKTQMLRNLNMFISRERLVAQNLPASWDDNKLRMLFQKYGGKGAVVKEARIMRDMQNVDEKGVGKSKEFGFVAFSSHEHALNALRSLNNNPNIFSAQKRPIVTFSIENKTMIKARQKRLEKSRLKNPKDSKFNPKLTKKPTEKPVTNVDGELKLEKFAGVAAKPGPQKMRSRYKLKVQAKLHHENLKKEKKNLKNAKKTLAEKKQEFTKQERQKINKKKMGEDNFAKMVSDYKEKLSGATQLQKTKWYT